MLLVVERLQLVECVFFAAHFLLHGLDLLQLLDNLLALDVDFASQLVVVLLRYVHAVLLARRQQVAPQPLDLLSVLLQTTISINYL